MDFKIVLMCLVFCVVVVKTKFCQKNDHNDHATTNLKALIPHKRVKRSKYFDTLPPGAMVYRRPSYGFPPRSIISNTPPPNYRLESDDPPYPQPPRSYGRKPQGLGDEDINNIVKYLSKQDLDKIISFAGGRERDNYNKKVVKSERDGNYQKQVQSQSDDTFSLNGPYIKAYNDQDRPYQVEYYNPSSNSIQDIPKYINTAQVINIPENQDPNLNYQQLYLGNNENNLIKRQVSNTPLYSQETKQSYENDGDNLVKDQEEQLPKPVNLREDTDEAIAAAQTRQVATVTRPDPSYKVESFGDLPVMDYHSKMFSVSSYNVPHYTITSSKSSYGSPPTPPVEPAPPASEAKEQSDAHLKAIKIWSHRSKGNAYTLHDDGTLSVERPLRPKYGPYGH